VWDGRLTFASQVQSPTSFFVVSGEEPSSILR